MDSESDGGLPGHVSDWLIYFDKYITHHIATSQQKLASGQQQRKLDTDDDSDEDNESGGDDEERNSGDSSHRAEQEAMSLEIDNQSSGIQDNKTYYKPSVGARDLLGPLLRKYWAREVVKIYSPRRDCDCLNITYDEDRGRETLFSPLEQFITLSTDPKSVFERLKQTDDPPKLCGRVFKSGEPTYSCRDCGLDPTCVLCVDCFKNRYVA